MPGSRRVLARPPWSLASRSIRPLPASHTRAVWSLEAVKMRAPSALNARASVVGGSDDASSIRATRGAVDRFAMAREFAQHLAAGGIPYPRGSVVGGSDKAPLRALNAAIETRQP